MTQELNVGEILDGHRVSALQWRAFVLCAAVLFVDGFDVQGVTYVAPAIAQTWQLGRGAFGPTFSAGLFGIMLGALLLAPLADRVGRRRVIIWSCVGFGVCTFATAWVGSLEQLLVLRFVTGLGLGGALPNAIGLASEYAPQSRRASIVMYVSSGMSLGSVGAGMAAARLTSALGWPAIFVVGGILPLVLALVLVRWLPESIRFLAASPGGQAEATRLARSIRPDLTPDMDIRIQAADAESGRATVADLFRDQRGAPTLLLWTAFFMSLLNVYLAINWLPTTLTASGFTIEEAAVMTSTYHAGGILGTYTLGLLMDRFGPQGMLIVAFLLAVAGFSLFATLSGLSPATTTVLLAVTGFGVIGAQIGLVTLASMMYPVAIRSTGLGWALGVGRLGSIVGPAIGGLLLSTGLDARRVYLICVVPALIGALAIALMRWRARLPPARPMGDTLIIHQSGATS